MASTTLCSPPPAVAVHPPHPRGPRPTTRTAVEVQGSDPLLVNALHLVLDAHPGVVRGAPEPDVTVVVTTRAGARELTLHSDRPVVLVTQHLDPRAVLALLDQGVVAVLSFAQAGEPGRLGDTVAAAARGEAVLPPSVQGRLLRHVRNLHDDVLAPAGLTPSGLTTRECDILRLVAEGHDTAAIAQTLAFSERTVKYALKHLMSRHELTSRAHAVAYAVRCGAI